MTHLVYFAERDLCWKEHPLFGPRPTRRGGLFSVGRGRVGSNPADCIPRPRRVPHILFSLSMMMPLFRRFFGVLLYTIP